jgi:adenosyl cobinamide kinase/adenosyl cobinamide phosphate guanylyltransferase
LQQVAKNYIEQNQRLIASALAENDTVNTFILSCISFHLKNEVVPQRPLNQLDKKIKTAAKKWMNLPQRASAEVLYVSNQMADANLLPINTLADVSQSVHGLRLLHSPALRSLAT